MSAANVNFPNPPGVDPNDNATGQLIGWSVAMVTLSGLAVYFRFVARFLVKTGNKYLHTEDWIALASLPFAWMTCFVAIRGATHDNFGRHIGDSTPASLHRYLIGLWIFELAYSFAITLAKLAIIALWWRIFDVKSCHICLIIVGVLEILWLTGCTFTLIFSCVPVNGFWDLDIPSQCIKQSTYWIGAALPNIFFDVVLLILPNFWIIRLNITKSQKVALCFIFMLGIFVIVCSSLRLWQLILYNDEDSMDLPWVMVGPAIWSIVEGNLSVVCCCLPSMRPLLRLLVHGRAQYGYDYSRQRYSNNRTNPAPTPAVDDAWRAGGSSMKMKPIPNDKVTSATGPEEVENWPLTPQTPTFITSAYQNMKQPESAPHRKRSGSFSTRALSRQADFLPGTEQATWLNLGDRSRDDGSIWPKQVRQLPGEIVSKREGMRSLRLERTNTASSTIDLERQPSVASVGAARNPRF